MEEMTTGESQMCKTKVAIGYCRVSSAQQASEGASLESQEAAIRAWAAQHGFEVADIFVDAGLSGGKADRPGLQKAVGLACKLRGALVAYSLSRVSRSVPDAYDLARRLEKANADLVSTTEPIDTTSPMGKAFFGMLSIVAQLERDQISERTKGVMGHLRREGKRISRFVPYGWNLDDDGKTLVANKKEMKTLAEMKRLRGEGLSFEKIAAALNKKGIPSKTGKAWKPASVYLILKRASLLGKGA